MRGLGFNNGTNEVPAVRGFNNGTPSVPMENNMARKPVYMNNGGWLDWVSQLFGSQNTVPAVGANSYGDARSLQGTETPEAFFLRNAPREDGRMAYPGQQDFMNNLLPPQVSQGGPMPLSPEEQLMQQEVVPFMERKAANRAKLVSPWQMPAYAPVPMDPEEQLMQQTVVPPEQDLQNTLSGIVNRWQVPSYLPSDNYDSMQDINFARYEDGSGGPAERAHYVANKRLAEQLEYPDENEMVWPALLPRDYFAASQTVPPIALMGNPGDFREPRVITDADRQANMIAALDAENRSGDGVGNSGYVKPDYDPTQPLGDPFNQPFHATNSQDMANRQSDINSRLNFLDSKGDLSSGEVTEYAALNKELDDIKSDNVYSDKDKEIGNDIRNFGANIGGNISNLIQGDPMGQLEAAIANPDTPQSVKAQAQAQLDSMRTNSVVPPRPLPEIARGDAVPALDVTPSVEPEQLTPNQKEELLMQQEVASKDDSFGEVDPTLMGISPKTPDPKVNEVVTNLSVGSGGNVLDASGKEIATPDEMNFFKGALADMLGVDGDNKGFARALTQAAIVALGGMLLGGSPEGSLAFAAKYALESGSAIKKRKSDMEDYKTQKQMEVNAANAKEAFKAGNDLQQANSAAASLPGSIPINGVWYPLTGNTKTMYSPNLKLRGMPPVVFKEYKTGSGTAVWMGVHPLTNKPALMSDIEAAMLQAGVDDWGTYDPEEASNAAIMTKSAETTNAFRGQLQTSIKMALEDTKGTAGDTAMAPNWAAGAVRSFNDLGYDTSDVNQHTAMMEGATWAVSEAASLRNMGIKDKDINFSGLVQAGILNNAVGGASNVWGGAEKTGLVKPEIVQQIRTDIYDLISDDPQYKELPSKARKAMVKDVFRTKYQEFMSAGRPKAGRLPEGENDFSVWIKTQF